MNNSNIITFRFPSGMNADDSGTVDKLTFTLNKKRTTTSYFINWKL